MDLPDSDFKDVSVVPTEKVLKERSLKFRAMPEEGDLVNTHNYLDILFRLLHEDGVADLRKGLNLLFQNKKILLDKKSLRTKLRDCQIKLYERLSILGVQAIEGCSCVELRLPTDKKRFVDWRISKRLLPGSLVILSPDEFVTIFIGLVKNRDSKQMNFTHKTYGYVPINIEVLKTNCTAETAQEIVNGFPLEEFLMIESTAYFEAYKHVLRQLQSMDTWPQLPFNEYFVHGAQETKRPKYMQDIFNIMSQLEII